MEEVQLIQALRRGDEEAYMRLFDLYYAPLISYASRIVHDSDLGHDIVQEVFCHLFECRDTLEVNSSLKAYLYQAVYHRCINEIRHLKLVADYAEHTLSEFYYDEVIQIPEAEMNLESAQMQKLIEWAIGQLPTRCQEIFRLCKVEGLSYREIAERLDISVKTVEAQMTKGLSLMRERLADKL